MPHVKVTLSESDYQNLLKVSEIEHDSLSATIRKIIARYLAMQAATGAYEKA